MAIKKGKAGEAGKADPSNEIQHISAVYSSQLKQATDLYQMSKKPSFAHSKYGKQSERVEAAAEMFLKIGDFHNYCEALIGLGNWERAIAFAPGVSKTYW